MGEYDKDFGDVISKCRYLVCLTHGFYGLSPRKDAHGEFIGFNLHDIGAMIPNIDQDTYLGNGYEFVFCSYNVVDGDMTLFVVFTDKYDTEKPSYHYAYINDDSFDSKYGITDIGTIVVSELVTSPD